MYPHSVTYVTMTGDILFGRSSLRREVLRAFFERGGLRAHVREVARVIGRAPAAVGRELERLERAGILRSAHVGRSRVYELAADSAVVRDLRPLVQRAFGAEAILREALAGVGGIEEAFIFGSYGTPAETPLSDIDVFVVGRPDEHMWERIVDAQRRLGRDVNVKHYTRDEVERLRLSDNEFIGSALAGRRATLVRPANARAS